MIWNTNEVLNLLSETDINLNSSESQISLGHFDAEQRIGVGRDGAGNVVLVLPGQSNVLAFATEGSAFEPWTQVHWVEESKNLEEVATLRCKLDNPSPDLLSAVAAVFVGIIDLQMRFGTCGDAIWEMKDLFDSKFKQEIDEKVVIGLLGELLVITSSQNKLDAISIWHSRNEASFDFSKDSLRIEVKASANLVREHYFSSNQISPGSLSEVYVVSILLHCVERGTTLEDLYHEILDSISDEAMCRKFSDVVISTLGVTPSATNGLMIDKESSLASIRYFSASQIPQPQIAANVLSMTWKASLSTIQTSSVTIDELLMDRSDG
jgi:hypothetical protein